MKKHLNLSYALAWLVIFLGVPTPLLLLLNRSTSSDFWRYKLLVILYCWLLTSLCVATSNGKFMQVSKNILNKQLISLSKNFYYIKKVLQNWNFLATFKVTRILQWMVFVAVIFIWSLIQFNDALTENIPFILTLNAYTFVAIILYAIKMLFGEASGNIVKR